MEVYYYHKKYLSIRLYLSLYFFFCNRYKKLERIGKGTFGIVYKAQDIITGNIVAVKKIILNESDQGIPAIAIREISILRELNHPNIERSVFLNYALNYYFYL